MRIGLAGLGVHGLRYAAPLLAGEISGAILTAVSRSDVERGAAFAAEHSLAFERDPRELAARADVDAVVLVLPPDLHPAAAVAALDAGKPVFVEKPMTPDAGSARKLADHVDAIGGWLMVGQTLRFDAVIEALLDRRNEIGELRAVTINQRFEPSDRPWIDTPGRGGLFLNTGVHGFDLVRHLAGGEPVSVVAEAARIETRATEDLFSAVFVLDNGALATVDNTRSTRSRSGRVELIGATGQLWGDHIHRSLEAVRGRERRELGPVPQRHTVPAALSAFAAALRDGSPPPVSAADGLAALEMIDAAERSAREGRRVLLSEVSGQA